LSSELERSLRRLKPEKRRQQLKVRSDAELPFLEDKSHRAGSLLYDTTVYIDILQGRFPGGGDLLLRSADAWHSTVAGTELASACGLLDPSHVGSRGVIRRILAIVDRVSPYRMLAPDRQTWCDAGILAGTIARLQGVSRTELRRILNDALIFATARRFGHTVLTRNIVDFDLLHQLDPSGKVLFYRV